MGKKIILHVGAPKCGSTFLQQVMLNNRELLLHAGIYYPHADDGRDHPGNADQLHRQFEEGVIAKHFDTGVNTVFLSHEDLFERPRWASALSEWIRKENIELSVIAFLRPYSEIIFGAYSQKMKENFQNFLQKRQAYDGKTLEQFGVQIFNNVNHALACRQWNDLCHPGSLHLHNYRHIKFVLESHIGIIPGMDWGIDKSLRNISLRVSDCDEIASAINDPSFSERHIRTLLEEAYKNSGAHDAGRSEQRAANLERLHSERTAEICENFGFYL